MLTQCRLHKATAATAHDMVAHDSGEAVPLGQRFDHARQAEHEDMTLLKVWNCVSKGGMNEASTLAG